MRFLIYASPFDVTGRDVLKIIRSMNHGCETMYMPSIEDFQTYLGQPAHMPDGIILMPQTVAEMDDLIRLSHLMRDTKVILMLPTGSQHISSDVNLLRPSFVGYAGEDISVLTAVIQKMAETNGSSPLKAIQ